MSTITEAYLSAFQEWLQTRPWTEEHRARCLAHWAEVAEDEGGNMSGWFRNGEPVEADWSCFRMDFGAVLSEPVPVTYGPEHRAMRAEVKNQIDTTGGWCTEVVCVKPDRQMPIGADFHLAHDHETGQYRGPAHVECNLQERARRGTG